MTDYIIRNKKTRSVIMNILNPESFKETDTEYQFYCAGMFVKFNRTKETIIELRR